MKVAILLGALCLASAAIAVAQDPSTQAAAVEQTLSSRSPVLIQAQCSTAPPSTVSSSPGQTYA
jgi:hypothetical protein